MPDSFYIAHWHIQPSLHRLSKDGEVVQIEPKIMSVLVYLAHQAGNVVSRPELLQAVWPDVVVGDEVVSRSISELRKVFGDNPRAAAFIETIPKAGYRLIAPVSTTPPTPTEVPVTPVAASDAILGNTDPERRRIPWLALALLLILLMLAGTSVWRFSKPAAVPEPTYVVRTIPITTTPGFEFSPALSPDGRQAAFIWSGTVENGPLNLYVSLIGVGDPLQLTDSPLYEWSPSWSPDGKHIAFARALEGIIVVPALGGAEQKLAPIGPRSRPQLDWSPQGDLIAFTDRVSADRPYQILLLSLETGAVDTLTTPSPHHFGDQFPVFSPDGQQLAFARTTDQASDLFLVSRRGGTPHRLTSEHGRIAGLTWSADGKEVIYSSNRGGTFGLWRMSISGGPPVAVSLSGMGNLREPSLRGDLLAYTHAYTDMNLWKYTLGDTAFDTLASPWLPSTRHESDPHFSPDGKRVAFTSSRSGHTEVWVADANGANPEQRTQLNGPHAGNPRWSPDGQFLAFDARTEGHADVYAVPAEGGIPRRLTTNPANDLLPSWSQDGSVYFASNRSGSWNIWNHPLDGGDAVQVTKNGGFLALEAADGASLYYSRRDTLGIWQKRLPDEEETLVVEHLAASTWGWWSLSEEALYYLPADASSPMIHRYDLASGDTHVGPTLRAFPLRSHASLAVHPAGTVLLATQLDESHYDIMASPYRP